ncbi:hypothetical protein MTR67_038357 [Solanum verrucosum]|uniref:Endonuclease/exonuclease/phosphatase domain-containing protein n=2 Tax=Solanum TaxID=4107 RepID=A0AAF0ZMQ0_SOLVR|nr:hypothetical protein MTR67_038357 [Solanum verrucosum]
MTMAYAYNTKEGRKELWESLMAYNVVCQLPWMILGDFNSVLTTEDRIGGYPVVWSEIEDFSELYCNMWFHRNVLPGSKINLE